LNFGKVGFIAYYEKNSIYSFNSIIAALETAPKIRNIDIYYVKSKKKLIPKIEEVLKKNEIIIIGFSIFSTQIWEISEIVRAIRKKYRENVYLIAGGPHPSGNPKGTLDHGFDYVFIGEAEKSFIKFIEHIKENKSMEDIPAIAYIDKNGNYIINKNRIQIDLNDYPPFPLKNTKYGAIEIARGCPFKCYFCQTSFMMGTKVRYRKVEEICKYVRILKSENLIDIRFITPNAFSYGSKDGRKINLRSIEKLLSNVKEIIGKNGRIFYGSFPSEVRPEHVNREVLQLILDYADNDNIIIGGQSGSQRMLDLCNRGHTVENIYEAVKITKECGLSANVDFIFGLPQENEEDRRDTRQVIKDLIVMGAKIHLHTFIPLPKTPFSSAYPKKLDKRNKEFIRRNLAKIYGNWKKHEKVAIKIWRELNKNN